jgi:hypothetical protein
MSYSASITSDKKARIYWGVYPFFDNAALVPFRRLVVLDLPPCRFSHSDAVTCASVMLDSRWGRSNTAKEPFLNPGRAFPFGTSIPGFSKAFIPSSRPSLSLVHSFGTCPSSPGQYCRRPCALPLPLPCLGSRLLGFLGAVQGCRSSRGSCCLLVSVRWDWAWVFLPPPSWAFARPRGCYGCVGTVG